MNDEVTVTTGMESPEPRNNNNNNNNNTQCLYVSVECTFLFLFLENYKPKCPKPSDHNHPLYCYKYQLCRWLYDCFFHAAPMFMSNGFEIQLHTARFSTPLQIRMTGSNTSSNQEINTTLCYIRWSRYISVCKVTGRTAGVRFPLRVGFFSV